MNSQKLVLVVTGGVVDLDQIRSYNEQHPGIFIVGVDGGCLSALKADFSLDLIYGDFDTLDPKVKEELFASDIEHIALNPDKDVTDTHGVLDELCSRGFKEVTIFGGMGSRMDHTMANLMVPFSLLSRMSITYIDSFNKIRFYEGPCIIEDEIANYRYLSVIPVTPIHIQATSGLKYNLESADLTPYDSLGISNEIINAYSIKLTSGRMMLIESNDSP